MTEQSSALALPDASALQYAYEPRSFLELKEVCVTLFQSRLLPKAVTSVEAAVYIAVRGRELGLSLGQSFAAIHIIDGKTVLAGDLIAARVRKSGICKVWRIEKLDNDECRITTQRTEDDKPTTLSWTMADARRAGLENKDNWRKFPRAMLRARCSAELARAVYPEVALGMYDPDEVLPANDIAPPGRVEFDVVIPAPEPPVDAKAKRGEAARAFAKRLRHTTGVDEAQLVWAEIQAYGFGGTLFEGLRDIYDQTVASLSTPEESTPEAS